MRNQVLGEDRATLFDGIRRGPGSALIEHLTTGRRYELHVGEYALGRCADSVIAFESNYIARMHGILRVEADSCIFRDLKPSNGSFKNGVRVPPGDEVRMEVGDTVSLAGVESFRLLERR